MRENNDLVNDVLGADTDFDAHIMNSTLEELRSRRRTKRRLKAAAVICLLAIAGATFHQLYHSPPDNLTNHHPARNPQSPAAAKSPHSRFQVITTAKTSVEIVRSSPMRSSIVVGTSIRPSLDVISDHELLLLAQAEKGVLIGEPGSGQQTLVLGKLEEVR